MKAWIAGGPIGRYGLTGLSSMLLLMRYLDDSAVEARKKIADYEGEIISLYADQHMSQHQISRHLGISRGSIQKVLKKFKIPVRHIKQQHKTTSDIPIEKIKEMNDGGMTLSDIANNLGVTVNAVSQRLKRNGIDAINWNKKFRLTKDQVIAMISEGLNPKEIADKSSIKEHSLFKIADQMGIKDVLLESKLVNPYEHIEDELISLYLDQKQSLRALCKRFRLHRNTIRNILDQNEVEIRDRNRSASFRVLHQENDACDQDSVSRALRGVGRFKNDTKTCYFYIYSLARYPQLSKIGITWDIMRRVDKEYGTQYLLVSMPTRLEAFFLERAVSYRTRHLKTCPNDLKDWGGYSEIRSLEPENICSLARQMHQELNQVGVWQFILNEKIRLKPDEFAEVKKRINEQ
jgi:predicted transcriptional regulator